MARISRLEDLLPLLGSVATVDDPLAALEQRGHTLSPALKKRLQPRRAPTPAQRRLWQQMAAKAGALRFTVGQPAPITPRTPSPNEYEFSAGVRMSAANQILAGLLANGTFPDVLFLDELLSPGDTDALQRFFRVDKPGGRMGRLQVTGPPTLAQIQDGLDRVAFIIPFRLNFERISKVLSGQLRTVVTFATGRMRFIVGLTAESGRDGSGAPVVEIQLDLSKASDARLELDANSPVQLVNQPGPGEIDFLAGIIQLQIRQKLAGSLRLSVSAVIPLPTGNLQISGDRIAVITRGDALLVGIKVEGTPGLGRPETLTPLFPNAESNFFIRVHEEILRLVLKQALRSGLLTNQAKKVHPDAVISSADVAFGEDTIKLVVGGKIVDLCPGGVDVGFTATATITITMEGTTIRVKKETDKSVDKSDAVLCAVTSLGLALVAAVVVGVLSGGLLLGLGAGVLTFGVAGLLLLILEFDGEDFALLSGGGGDDAPTIIDLDFPFPHTDLLPTLTGAFVRLDESTMLMAGNLGTRPDDLNTYLYVRFMEADALGIARPMRGARVRLIDRDSPQPAGDDVTLPAPSTTESTRHTPRADFAVTTETRFEPTADETFGEATTDHRGRARFYVPRNKLASQAALKVVKTTSVNLDTDQEIRSTRRTPVPEARPDFYFRVTRADGSVIDTLQLAKGFFRNFESARVGTPTNPLTITFGGITLDERLPVVLDPGVQ